MTNMLRFLISPFLDLERKFSFLDRHKIVSFRLLPGICGLLALLVAWNGGVSELRAERIYLDITAQDVRKVVVAVPWFASLERQDGDPGQGREMAELMGRALEFHGFIQVLDPARYGGGNKADWRALGVDYVVLGKFDQADTALMLEGRLLDVGEDRILTGRRYRGALPQRDDMVLRFCDFLIEEFTGEPGISRSRIAFVSDVTGSKELYVSGVLGSGLRQVTRHHHLVVSPRFSPDGNFLAYSSYHSGNQNLYVTDLRQNKVTRALSRRKGMNLAPAWSPDGQSMVVTLSKDGSPDLYLLDRRGKIKQRLTKRAGINVSASWSPDGKSLVFVSDRSGSPQLYVMDVKSRKVQRLTFEGSENTEPSWSPKGDRIAFTGRKNGRYQIFTMDPKSPLVLSQVTSGNADFESPSWSPDGRQLAFTRRIGNRQVICAAMKDGSGFRVLLRLKGNQSYPQWAGPPGQ